MLKLCIINMKTLQIILFLLTINQTFGQLEFTKQERLYFLGADSIEDKKIISAIYITPIDSFNLNVQFHILDDWKHKDSMTVHVGIDTSSIMNDKYFIYHVDSFPCYRFSNTAGFEILIAKERFHESYDQYGVYQGKTYSIGFAQLILPNDRMFYVKSLPLMFEK